MLLGGANQEACIIERVLSVNRVVLRQVTDFTAFFFLAAGRFSIVFIDGRCGYVIN